MNTPLPVPPVSAPGPVVPAEKAFAGVLLGTAAGDSVGLPGEGLRPETVRRRWPGPWRHRLLPGGRGMWSDDTEHTLMVAQSLLEHPDDVAGFQRALARRLRWWLAALPAGVGLATARSIFRLWVGIAPERAGVFSAGNGPAMRCAVIGVYFARDQKRRVDYVAASTRLTHTDPKALTAARAVAELAAAIARGDRLETAEALTALLATLDPDPAWLNLAGRMTEAAAGGVGVAEFATGLGLRRGVTGYAWHSVPVAVYAWWRHRGDFRATLEAAYACGGDTDTVGAIAGALAGAELGPGAIPGDWLAGLLEWPRSTRWVRSLAGALSHSAASHPRVACRPPAWCWPALPLRNLCFLGVVLLHGFGRLVPH